MIRITASLVERMSPVMSFETRLAQSTILLMGLLGGLACAAASAAKDPAGIDAAIHECPAEDCGPPLGMPVAKCDGSDAAGGPTGRCIRQGDGICGWEFIECPPAPLPAPEAVDESTTGGATTGELAGS